MLLRAETYTERSASRRATVIRLHPSFAPI
jgi:hypothetical protein